MDVLLGVHPIRVFGDLLSDDLDPEVVHLYAVGFKRTRVRVPVGHTIQPLLQETVSALKDGLHSLLELLAK